MTRTLGAALVVTLAFAGTAPGQAQEEFSWRERVDRLLDRWTSDPGSKRLDRAADILATRLEAVPDDAAALLELGRVELARGNLGAALAHADKATTLLGEERRSRREALQAGAAREDADGAADEGEDEVLERIRQRRVQARALTLLAARYMVHEKLLERSDPAASRRYLEEQTEALEQRRAALVGAAGSEEAAAEALAAETQRRDLLRNLDRLGAGPPRLGTPDTEGKPVDFSRYGGQVVLVLFWGQELVDTSETIAAVDALLDEHRDRGFAVVGVNLDQERETFDAAVAAQGLEDWRHVYAGGGWLSQEARAWSVRTLPAGLLLDHSGRVRYVDPWGPELAPAVADLLERRDTR